jgi:hypothetical protein
MEHNWLQIWWPSVIIDSAKAAAAFALKSIQPLTHHYFLVTRLLTQSKHPQDSLTSTKPIFAMAAMTTSIVNTFMSLPIETIKSLISSHSAKATASNTPTPV